jgi:hypothetical protein
VATTCGAMEPAIWARCDDSVVRRGVHNDLDPGSGCWLSRVTESVPSQVRHPGYGAGQAVVVGWHWALAGPLA